MRRFQSSGVLGQFLLCMAAAMPVYPAETAQQIVISKAQLNAAAIQTAMPTPLTASQDGILTLRGTAVAAPGAQVAVSMPEDVLLTAVLQGNLIEVKAGEAVVRLSSPMFVQLQRDLVDAASARAMANRDLQRDQALFKDGLIPKVRLDRTQQAAIQASAADQAARQRLKLMGVPAPQIASMAAGRLAADWVVPAPRSGQIFSKQQQRRFELGEISTTDSQQSKLDYQVQLAQLQAAQLDEQRAAAALQEQFPGSSALIQVQPAPQSMENRPEELLLTDSEQKNWIDRMIEENHGLELARVQSELAASQASRKAAEKLADPTLALTYSRERNNAEQILGLQVNFPIGGAKRSELTLQAQSQAEQSRLAFELANRGAQTQATLTTQAYTQAAAAWKIYASTQQAQLDLFQKQLRAYSLSEISQFELQAARLRTAQVQLDALKARLDAEKAAARLLIDSHVLWAAPESVE